MKNWIYGVLLLVTISSCKNDYTINKRSIKTVTIETIKKDSLLNVRALEVNEYGVGFFASSKGDLGFIYEQKYIDTKYNYKEELTADIFHTLKYDTDSIPNFRSLAKTKHAIFALSIGSPAVLVRISEDHIWPVVYREDHKDVFYDSMEFWNDEEGIAVGDTTDDCLSIIITRDGGESWTKLSCEDLPKGLENEGAFAASDTNIAIVDNHTWIATTAGRIYYSGDKGLSWEVFETPIVKEKDTEGIYSIDFYDEINGFAIGGDYTKPSDSRANKIRTQDGGKTWQLVAENKSPGYRSCVQYLPNSNGKELVAVGFNGIDYSNDSGDSWTHLSDEGFYTLRFLNDSIAYAAGSKRISKLLFRE